MGELGERGDADGVDCSLALERDLEDFEDEPGSRET